MKIRTRIAPSPTGSPHIGTVYTALFNYCFAKKNKGEFLIRIEDTDRSRIVENTEQEIIDALKWLKLVADEGPGIGGKFGPYRQSERLEIYKKYAEELVSKDLAYYCNCSSERLTKLREDQQSRKEIPHYDRKCRYEKVADKQNCVIRFSTPLDGETTVVDAIRGEIKFQNQIIDDQVLVKSDGFPTYHLASVVDDHLMEISHVIRAEEWISSTPKHVLLYEAFGWERPVFAHIPILRNQDKSKISKRRNPVSVFYYKDEGYLPEALLNFLALMGWSMPEDKEIFSLEEMIQAFTLDRISVVGPVFDIEKLKWLNGHYIRSLSDQDLATRLRKYSKYSPEQISKVLPLVKERLKKLNEFDSLVSYFFENVTIDKDLLVQKGKTSRDSQQVLELTLQTLPASDWNTERIEGELSKLPEKLGWSRTDFFQTIRVAVTGTKASPPLFDTLFVLGQDTVQKRLKKALELLSH